MFAKWFALGLCPAGASPFASLLILLALGLGFPKAVPLRAQSYAGCSATRQAWALTNPELHCTCASERDMPSCTSTGSGRAGSGAVSTKAMMQQELVGALMQGFMNMLFSNNARANAQKQRMMEELEKRKAEAEQQHRIAEAKRIQAICDQLTATLKLSGLPNLSPKESGSGGLQLKLGDGSERHVGVPELPGIALNDNTGDGGNTPYGIPGLPGIYTNGPRSTRAETTGGEPKLQLKFGENEPVPAQAAQTAPPPPVAPAGANQIPQQLADAMRDPQNMTPQQLADAASLVGSLQPEEQQQLVSAAIADSQSAAGQGAAGQLQPIAQTSQAAANAQTAEGAAAGARAGFDQAVPGASLPRPQSTPGAQPQAVQASGVRANSPTPAGEVRGTSIPATSPALVGAIDLSKLDPGKPAVVAPLSTGTAGRAAGCPISSTKKLPTREELALELSTLRFKLNVLKGSLTRLNRSIQMDQEQFAQWRKETEDAVERARERLKQMVVNEMKGRFFDFAKERYSESPNRLQAVKNVELLFSEKDVYDWADNGRTDWEQIAEGLALLGENLPISKNAKDVLSASKDTIDSAFDIATEIAAWRRISQLQVNSDAYLAATRQSGEQMKRIVTRMQEIEDRLATGNYAASPQPSETLCEN